MNEGFVLLRAETLLGAFEPAAYRNPEGNQAVSVLRAF